MYALMLLQIGKSSVLPVGGLDEFLMSNCGFVCKIFQFTEAVYLNDVTQKRETKITFGMKFSRDII